MRSELTPISEESLPFVHRHPVVVAAFETVGAVAIVIALQALGVLAHSPAKRTHRRCSGSSYYVSHHGSFQP